MTMWAKCGRGFFPGLFIPVYIDNGNGRKSLPKRVLRLKDINLHPMTEGASKCGFVLTLIQSASFNESSSP